MQLFWYRILPFLSLLISIFVLIVIILINVGGVNSGHSNSLDYNHVQNGAFRLVKWRYNATPTQQSSSSTRGTYDLAAEIFLNRICTGSSWGTTRGSLHGAYPPTSCYNTRLDVLSPSSLKSSGYTEAFRRLTNFNFDDVYLTSPFALYVVAAITCFAMMFLSVVESFKGYKKGTGKGLRIAGLVCTALTWLFLLVASTLTTQLSLRLRNQIASQTRFSSNVRTLGPYGNAPGTEVWQVRLTGVKVGATVLVLTWLATVFMGLNLGVWTQVLVGGLERERGERFKWNTWGWWVGRKTAGGNGHGGKVEREGMEMGKGRREGDVEGGTV